MNYPAEVQSLFDQSSKFDENKVRILDEITLFMQSGDKQKVT